MKYRGLDYDLELTMEESGELLRLETELGDSAPLRIAAVKSTNIEPRKIKSWWLLAVYGFCKDYLDGKMDLDTFRTALKNFCDDMEIYHADKERGKRDEIN